MVALPVTATAGERLDRNTAIFTRPHVKIPVLHGTGISCVLLPLVAGMYLKTNIQVVSATSLGMI